VIKAITTPIYGINYTHQNGYIENNLEHDKSKLLTSAISADNKYFAAIFLGLYIRCNSAYIQYLYCLIYEIKSGILTQKIEIGKTLETRKTLGDLDLFNTKKNRQICLNNNFKRILSISYKNSRESGLNIYNKELKEYQTKITEYEEDVNFLITSKNGRFLSFANNEGNIKVWEIFDDNVAKNYVLYHGNQVNSLIFSPNEQLLVSGGDNIIKIWEVETGELIGIINHKYYGCKSLIFSPDGNTIFGITDDKNITQWDINTKEEIRTFSSHESNIITLAIHPEGKILASSYEDNTVKFWYIPTGEELHSLDEEVRVMSWSEDGQTFATLNNGSAKLWRSL
jgi:WD40 repeat protein